jgi:hypothetical protein
MKETYPFLVPWEDAGEETTRGWLARGLERAEGHTVTSMAAVELESRTIRTHAMSRLSPQTRRSAARPGYWRGQGKGQTHLSPFFAVKEFGSNVKPPSPTLTSIISAEIAVARLRMVIRHENIMSTVGYAFDVLLLGMAGARNPFASCRVGGVRG